MDFFRRREPLSGYEDPGLVAARRKAEAATRTLEAVQKFKAQYPDYKIIEQGQQRAQAMESTSQGQMWGWGWPRGSGAKWPGGMSTPWAGLSINHWQLRQQARDITFDVPAAKALITRFADSTIGTGLKLEPTPKFDILGISADEADEWASDTRERYALFCKNRNQNRSRGMSWYQAQHLLQLTAERDNDEFVRLYYSQDPSLLSPLQFEIIDANMIRGDAFTVTNVIGKFPDGIVRNADGSEKAYRIWVQNMAEDQFTYQFDQVDIPRVGEKSGRLFMLHAFDQEYAGQGRGFSGIGAIVQELELIEDTILSCAKKFINQSNINMFVKPSPNAPASNIFDSVLQNAAGPASFSLGVPGSAGTAMGGVPVTTNPVTYTPIKEATIATPGGVGVFNLQEGEDLVLPPNDAPAQFKEFVMTHLSIISASKGMPLSILIIAFNGSYSASRGELLVFEETLKMKRQDFDANLESPLYEMWLSCEIAAGRIACPGWSDPLLRAAWTAHRLNGTPMPNIDPSQTAEADKAYLQMGAQTPEDVARNFNGSSFQHNLARNKKAAPSLPVWPFEKKYSDKGEDPSSPAPTPAKGAPA
jgi:capsid protein